MAKLTLLPPILCACVSAFASHRFMRCLASDSHLATALSRHLKNLAVADLVFSLGFIVHFFFYPFSDDIIMLIPCGVGGLFVDLGVFASAIVEVFLALSLWAALYQSLTATTYLSHLLTRSWGLAAIFTFAECFISTESLAQVEKVCTETPASFSNAVTLLCALLIVLVYLGCVVKILQASDWTASDQFRCLSRLRYFLLVWLVCTCPNALRNAGLSTSLSHEPLRTVCRVLVALRGTANALFYALHSFMRPRQRHPLSSRSLSSRRGRFRHQPLEMMIQEGETEDT